MKDFRPMVQPSGAAHDRAALAARLRQLRVERWPEAVLTQPQLAAALGVGASSVSSWESATAAKVPPLSRLDGYATFFATRRSLGAPALLSPDDLTADERAERERLRHELMDLRGGRGDPGETRSLWQFPDGNPVRLICGELSRENRKDLFTSAKRRNYIQLQAYADLDAMVELYGHVRAENPGSDVQFDLAPRLEHDDLQSHLVMLGGIAMDQGGRTLLNLLRLPITQVEIASINNGEVFEVEDDGIEQHGPEIWGDIRTGDLISDVGLFVRAPNPNNQDTTLTILSGVFTRGTYGAVRCLTDPAVRDGNHQYLAERFDLAKPFAVLMKVPVLDHATATPDLRVDTNRLFEWPR
jgi:transcriptional regulator with XRE-family HTH domain